MALRKRETLTEVFRQPAVGAEADADANRSLMYKVEENASLVHCVDVGFVTGGLRSLLSAEKVSSECFHAHSGIYMRDGCS